jgi:hypothetical protein
MRAILVIAVRMFMVLVVFRVVPTWLRYLSVGSHPSTLRARNLSAFQAGDDGVR